MSTKPEQHKQTVLIHFTADRLTAFGQVWYRGQELEIGPGHPRWPEAADWITLTPEQQVQRFGEQKFAPGPWPGPRPYHDPGFEPAPGR